MKTLLVIGHTFPEPKTTAAGCRMMQLLNLFLEDGFQITFATTASISEKSADLNKIRISVEAIQLNHSSFDNFIKIVNPSIVLFDRYITEEQFGWRVTENCPDALKILDTEDLHFLRKARETVVEAGFQYWKADLFTETTKRELASILRCDLSLIISETEMKLLQNTFRISSSILYYLPFLIETLSKENIQNLPVFEAREHFVTIGNFLHSPNVDSIFFLKNEIWPLIKKELPQAELHIYGAYAPQKIIQLHNEKEGFLIKGWVEDSKMALQNAKVVLAPLRFGAGLKGKLIEAMQNGTPAITTPVGAEGVCGEFSFPGCVAENVEDFAKAAVRVYNQKDYWFRAQQEGFDVLQERFSKKLFAKPFLEHVFYLSENRKTHREQNFIGQILQHHSLQSTKYLSRWIEEKERQK